MRGNFPHDHARSRAYRWNEDGMAGVSDVFNRLCLGLALWNGRDPILKERMFGLANPEGNHGEDVKEYWWYLDALPSRAWLRWRYHYPQAAFPYEDLIERTRARGKLDPEYELLDTGVFDDDRYWIVEVTYAKASPTDILMRIVVPEPGPEAATRSTSCRRSGSATPGRGIRSIAAGAAGLCRWARDPSPSTPSSALRLEAAPHPTARCRAAVLRERDEHRAALRRAADHAVPQGRHQRPRRRRGRRR